MAAVDQFRDRTMSFGEHLDELRTHLLRAVYGVILVAVVLMYFGNYVVILLVSPVEAQLKVWFEEQLGERTAKFVDDQMHLPVEKRDYVQFPVTFGPEQVGQLAERLGVAAPPKDAAPLVLDLKAPVAQLLRDLTQPLANVNRRWALKTLSAQEAFVIYFKAVLGAAIVVASPWVFYQLYSFVSVGLYAHERRFVNLSLPFSVGLFLTGVLVCYFLVFPRMLSFFLMTNKWMNIEPDIRLNEWVGFSVILMLIFGVGFQLPLLMLLLERVGLLRHEWMVKQRKMAIMSLAVLSAVATPGGDPITMLFLAVPLYILFELGLFLMVYFQRHNPFAVEDRRVSEVDAEI